MSNRRNRIADATTSYLPTAPAPATDAQLRAEEDALIAQAEAIVDRRLRRWTDDTMTDPGAAGAYIKLRLGARPTETMLALFLDGRHRLLAAEELFHGHDTGCEVHPRVIAQRALALNANAVILGHNHPSGNPEPSAADRAVTARTKQALALLDVRLLDHFVCGVGQPVSLAARGWV